MGERVGECMIARLREKRVWGENFRQDYRIYRIETGVGAGVGENFRIVACRIVRILDRISRVQD